MPVVQIRYGGRVSANTYLCTAHSWPGGSRDTSDPTPGGVSDLSSFLPDGTHAPLGNRGARVPSRRKLDKSEPPPGVGAEVFPDPSSQLCAVPKYVLADTLPPYLLCTTGTPPSSVVSLVRRDQSPSLAACTPTPKIR